LGSRYSGGAGSRVGFACCGSRDNRLTSVCFSSTIHGRRLLSFACPKESNQRKGAPSDPRRSPSERFAKGGRVSARSLAPPACGARGWSVRPSPLLRGNPKSKSPWIPAFAGMTAWGVSPISGASAAGTAALCSSRAPLGRGEQVEETAACSARGRPQDAGAFDESTGMCSRRTPEPARVVTWAGMPA
jgi:hypothetical protein